MKKLFFAFIAILSFTFSATAQDEVQSITPIPQADKTLISLKEKAIATRTSKGSFSSQNWAEAKMATYKNGLRAIIVPVSNSTKDRGLVSMTFLNGKEVSETFILEIIPEKTRGSESKQSIKTAAFYTLDGTKLHEASYKLDKIVGVTDVNPSTTARLNGKCFGKCLKAIYPSLPESIKAACSVACVACISQVWIACIPCAVCVIVPAAACLITCN
jgi:hypothetical protein